jgi:glycosyltransferase involved in cell wall biosynthesis
MIVKDEQDVLEIALSSVKGFADEIIIVDTGSNDNTKKIARKFTNKIYDFKWIDDFSAARNFSLSKATGNWILVLDADEVIDPENLKKSSFDPNMDAILLLQRDYTKNKNSFRFSYLKERDKFTKDYEGYVPYPIIRLFKNRKEIFYQAESMKPWVTVYLTPD